MDFKLYENVLEFINFQKNILRKYRSYIKEKMQSDYKKAAIFVYWLNDYIEYIRNEDKFIPGHLINYKRGQIVLVNFGYRIGSELGGNHYAIVLDMKNSRHNDTLTIVPLKSKKEVETPYSKIYHVPLGECVIDLLNDKADKIEKEYHEAKEVIVNEAIAVDIDKNKKASLRAKIGQINRELRIAKNIRKYTQKMKRESVADVGQIITISKQRIVLPCKRQDVLSNVIVPQDVMCVIDAKLKFLYCNVDEG